MGRLVWGDREGKDRAEGKRKLGNEWGEKVRGKGWGQRVLGTGEREGVGGSEAEQREGAGRRGGKGGGDTDKRGGREGGGRRWGEGGKRDDLEGSRGRRHIPVSVKEEEGMAGEGDGVRAVRDDSAGTKKARSRERGEERRLEGSSGPDMGATVPCPLFPSSL